MPEPTVGAEGAVTEPEVPTVNPEVPENAEPEGGEPDPQGKQDQRETEPEEKPHKKGGWQRKIERLEKQNEALIQALLQQQTKPVEPAKPASAPAEDKRPRKEDFKIDDEHYDADKYEDALLDWNRRQAKKELLEEIEKREQKSKQLTESEKVQQAFQERQSAYMAEHEDYEEAAVYAQAFLQRNRQSPAAGVIVTAIMESDFGPNLLHELGSKDGEIERLLKMSPVNAVKELGKIEARLATEKPAATQEADSEEELEPAKPPVIKAPPKPPSPVKKVSPAAKTADEILRDPNTDWDTWLKTRNKQLEQRRG